MTTPEHDRPATRTGRAVGRPRRHDRGALLDHARDLWVERGTAGVTIRALSSASGVSNGAIYNAFTSRDGLLAAVWTREAAHFLDFQYAAVDRARAEDGSAADTVVAAALAPARYAASNERAAHLLLAVRPDDLVTPELTDEQRHELLELRKVLGELIVRLADAQWGRRDRNAVTLIRYCIVELPGALLLRGGGLLDPVAHHALEHAVRGIVSAPPPPRG
ncbi:TetR/AcrR family transcriptional regulator [Rhodococcus sp. Z13]|uniref:TetR/AcrR family transcriptional regulator n=1 Tax=Rhodococcus sacchari TaxID=2962047 RepID=A0ACD4DLP6_9NOCA|nr:TetR/AcrR family transcriptional regulator [Rhodococcus sp. Z13]UYP20883.1 TetR/AcrR family transcriptional regulator [Rhodococcus sp. Z13]